MTISPAANERCDSVEFIFWFFSHFTYISKPKKTLKQMPIVDFLVIAIH